MSTLSLKNVKKINFKKVPQKFYRAAYSNNDNILYVFGGIDENNIQSNKLLEFDGLLFVFLSL